MFCIPWCVDASNPLYVGRHALQNELGKELFENNNRKERHCEGDERSMKAKY